MCRRNPTSPRLLTAYFLPLAPAGKTGSLAVTRIFVTSTRTGRRTAGKLPPMAFTRPAFQFLIYLAHFVLGRDWASYQLINCFAVAGMGAVAFQIAQTALGLRTGPSLVAAMLVVLSPPVLELVAVRCRVCYRTARHCCCSWRLPCGSRSPRLSLSCVAFSGATDQREHCVGASRSGHNHHVASQADTSRSVVGRLPLAAMLLPVAMWLGLRFAFFGGIGGTYATAGYTPFADFLKLIFRKLTHMHYLFITHKVRELLPDQGTARILDRVTAIMIYTLLFLWALRILPEAVNRARSAAREMNFSLPVDAFFLVALWAAIALAFHLALPFLRTGMPRP